MASSTKNIPTFASITESVESLGEDEQLDIPSFASITESVESLGEDEQLDIPTFASITEEIDGRDDASTDPDSVLEYDDTGGTYTDYTTEATNDTADDVPLWTGYLNDILYIGHENKFDWIRVDVTTPANGNYRYEYEYWDGDSWESVDGVVNTGDGTEPFGADAGNHDVLFDEPDDWAQTAVNGVTKYWLRLRCDYKAYSTTEPLGKRIYLNSGAAAYSDTLTDTITLSDAITQAAEETLADTITLTDDLAAGGQVSLDDTVTLSDDLSQAAAVSLGDNMSLTDLVGMSLSESLADGVSLADAIEQAAAKVIADTLSLSDDVAQAAAKTLADSLSLSDVLTAGSQLSLSESVVIADALVQAAHSIVADTLGLSDSLVAEAKVELSDTISLSDNLSGDLGYAFVVPGTDNVSTDTLKGGFREHRPWTKIVTDEPSPVTAFTQSSANTKYDKTSVEDATTWDLSQVRKGDIVVTEDNLLGVVESTETNKVNINGWYSAGRQLRGMAELTPTDGQTATIHKLVRANRIILRSHLDNDGYVYIGVNDAYVDSATGHPINPNQGQINSEITIERGNNQVLNAGLIWVVAPTEQKLVCCGGVEYVQAGPSSGERLSDSIQLQDNLTAIGIPATSELIEDTITLSDNLSQATKASRELSDTINLSDGVSGILSGEATPILGVTPTELDYVATASYKTITISNTGEATLNWSLSGVPSHLIPDISSGSIAAGGSTVVTIYGNAWLLSEGDREIDTITVTSNGGNQDVEVDICRKYVDVCGVLNTLPESGYTISSSPTDASTRGDVTFDPSVANAAQFAPDRGGWNITISGNREDAVAFIVVSTKNCVPFVSGSPFNLDEQESFDIYINGDLTHDLEFGRTAQAQYRYKDGDWELLPGTDVDNHCGSHIDTGAITTSTSHSIGGIISPAFFIPDSPQLPPEHYQASPYTDENLNGVYASDRYSATIDYEVDGSGAVVARSPGVPQGSLTRAASGSGIPLLYYAPLTGYAYIDTYVNEKNAGVDILNGSIPDCSFSDGRIDVEIRSLLNGYYHHESGYEKSVPPHDGGGYYLDISGAGDAGQVIILSLKVPNYIASVTVGANDKYYPNKPYGYLIIDAYVGYVEGYGTIPGANYHTTQGYRRNAQIYWGSNVVDNAYSSGGIEPQIYTDTMRVCLKKSGSNWEVQWVENAFILNSGITDIINVTY